MKNLEKITLEVYKFLSALNLEARIFRSGLDICIEPNTRKTGALKAGSLDGMQIIYFDADQVFEVSESQCGEGADELRIYKETGSLATALKALIKGNNRKPIKIY
jgi:hypothetical protein